mmetsp:Transcript_8747/g.19401  ORF Transcript_8747/g.19401 Transcript_8747/m.19401 type:complete len:231 (-) Transcript_8747:454-1146(-)
MPCPRRLFEGFKIQMFRRFKLNCGCSFKHSMAATTASCKARPVSSGGSSKIRSDFTFRTQLGSFSIGKSSLALALGSFRFVSDPFFLRPFTLECSAICCSFLSYFSSSCFLSCFACCRLKESCNQSSQGPLTPGWSKSAAESTSHSRRFTAKSTCLASLVSAMSCESMSSMRRFTTCKAVRITASEKVSGTIPPSWCANHSFSKHQAFENLNSWANSKMADALSRWKDVG